ncbi:Uncharacterised protein [BD1-7 clade bacterium]|uniref:Phage virion morphogenesis protein n=1 Tax=BD1-7 clade bacterium TaxID=2029982 RepID=A0A5S9P390_9GAMM|nr:Uncharacterised protein [BD1-7 clade bacterium]CAA0122856.1 Uncharacterised protein [BD1-7 clade bacterium]
MSTELTLHLAELNHRIQQLADANVGELLPSLATEGESQTRRRIETEKTAPDGSPWLAWSEGYTKTRHSNHSLLENEGNLLDSITADHNADTAIWGSNLPYAAAQQFGYKKRNLPAREYLGLSQANRADMIAIIDNWVDQQLRT